MHMSFFMIIILLAGLGLLIGLVLWAVLAASRGRSGSDSVPPPPPEEAVSPKEKQEMRTRVLQELAEGKITREQAEQKMGAMRNPPPAVPATPGAGGRSPAGRGCLWAVLIAVVAGIVCLTMFLLFFGVQVSHVAF